MSDMMRCMGIGLFLLAWMACGGDQQGPVTPVAREVENKPARATGGKEEPVCSVIIELCDEAWDPTLGGTTIIKAYTVGEKVGSWEITLYEVSDEPGYCMNAPILSGSGVDTGGNPTEHSDGWKDLQFIDNSPDCPGFWNITSSALNYNDVAKSSSDRHTVKVKIKSFDYGAYGKLKVKFTPANGSGSVTGKTKEGGKEYITIPRDENGNHIRDKADQDKGPNTTTGTTLSTAATDDTDDEPTLIKGDGLTRYEEWRGFMSQGEHKRTSVKKRTLFVYDADDIGLGYISSGSGLEVIEIKDTEWTGEGHSAEGKRKVNFNRATPTGATDHYGLWLHSVPKSAGNRTGKMYPETGFPDEPQSPKNTYVCTVGVELIKEIIPDTWGQKMIDRTIAHELAHGCLVTHHELPLTGGQQCIMRYMRDPLEESFLGTKFCITDDKCQNKIDVR